MHKRKTYIVFISIIVFMVIALVLFGQLPGDKIKEDGPTFTGEKTSYDPGILILDNGAQLTPHEALQLHDYSLNPLTIDGIHWTYPIGKYSEGSDAYIDHATDVDNIGDPLYLITDVNNNKIFTYNYESERAIWVYKNSELAGPVDADYFFEGREKKVLITYYTQHVVQKVDESTQNIVWSYGKIANPGNKENELRNPSDAEKT